VLSHDEDVSSADAPAWDFEGLQVEAGFDTRQLFGAAHEHEFDANVFDMADQSHPFELGHEHLLAVHHTLTDSEHFVYDDPVSRELYHHNGSDVRSLMSLPSAAQLGLPPQEIASLTSSSTSPHTASNTSHADVPPLLLQYHGEDDFPYDSDGDLDNFLDEGGKPSIRQVQSRNHHNTLERGRRIQIRHCYNSLKIEIPHLRERKVYSLTILQEAAMYIEALKRQESALLSEISRLRQDNATLAAQQSIQQHSKL
jgi:hypothetical protein